MPRATTPFNPEAEWARSTEFQRHAAAERHLADEVGHQPVWRLPVGSGNYYQTNFAANPFGHGGTTRYVTAPTTVSEAVADRFDGPTSFAIGDVVPRNALRAWRCTAWTCGCRRTSTCPAA